MVPLPEVSNVRTVVSENCAVTTIGDALLAKVNAQVADELVQVPALAVAPEICQPVKVEPEPVVLVKVTVVPEE